MEEVSPPVAHTATLGSVRQGHPRQCAANDDDSGGWWWFQKRAAKQANIKESSGTMMMMKQVQGPRQR